MTEVEFQRVILHELKSINTQIDSINSQINSINSHITNINSQIININTRQDEIYQIVQAIEHSNQVRKAELENQNIRLIKVEGKLKKVAKVYNEEDDNKASNL